MRVGTGTGVGNPGTLRTTIRFADVKTAGPRGEPTGEGSLSPVRESAAASSSDSPIEIAALIEMSLRDKSLLRPLPMGCP